MKCAAMYSHRQPRARHASPTGKKTANKIQRSHSMTNTSRVSSGQRSAE